VGENEDRALRLASEQPKRGLCEGTRLAPVVLVASENICQRVDDDQPGVMVLRNAQQLRKSRGMSRSPVEGHHRIVTAEPWQKAHRT
jgi:hypothetical protein